jgi:hypothetical protein
LLYTADSLYKNRRKKDKKKKGKQEKEETQQDILYRKDRLDSAYRDSPTLVLML